MINVPRKRSKPMQATVVPSRRCKLRKVVVTGAIVAGAISLGDGAALASVGNDVDSEPANASSSTTVYLSTQDTASGWSGHNPTCISTHKVRWEVKYRSSAGSGITIERVRAYNEGSRSLTNTAGQIAGVKSVTRGLTDSVSMPRYRWVDVGVDTARGGEGLTGEARWTNATAMGDQISFLFRTHEAGANSNLCNADHTLILYRNPAWGSLTGGVERLYRAYFLRDSDPGGFDYWSDRALHGTSLSTISAFFEDSPEFVATYGSLNDFSFVNLVYNNVLGRPADAGGANYWRGRLAAGLSRGDMMLYFSDSAEFRSRTGIQ